MSSADAMVRVNSDGKFVSRKTGCDERRISGRKAENLQGQGAVLAV